MLITELFISENDITDINDTTTDTAQISRRKRKIQILFQKKKKKF